MVWTCNHIGDLLELEQKMLAEAKEIAGEKVSDIKATKELNVPHTKSEEIDEEAA